MPSTRLVFGPTPAADPPSGSMRRTIRLTPAPNDGVDVDGDVLTIGQQIAQQDPAGFQLFKRPDGETILVNLATVRYAYQLPEPKSAEA